MSCMKPVQLFKNAKTGLYQLKYDKNCDPNGTIIVPCGKCPDCARKWRTQLAQRARYEFLRYGDNKTCFITLTVSDDNIDKVFPNGSLDHTEFQKFMKRLRSKLKYHGFSGSIKYICCGEYGEKNGRPHFHVLMYGWKPHDLKAATFKSKKGYTTWKSDFLTETWGFGFVDVGEVSEHTAPYMAKYVTKFKEIKQEEFTINGKQVRKPYLVYPREMLGLRYFLDNYKEILRRQYIVTSKGYKVGIPKSWLQWCKNILVYKDHPDYRYKYEHYKDVLNEYKLYKWKQEQYRIEELEKLDGLGLDPYAVAVKKGIYAREVYKSKKGLNIGK